MILVNELNRRMLFSTLKFADEADFEHVSSNND